MTENVVVLQKAFEEKDIPTIQKTAHKIKPSINQMGISSLHEVVKNLEKYDSSITSSEDLESAINLTTSTLKLIVEDLKKK